MAEPFVLSVNLQIDQVLGLDKVKQQLTSASTVTPTVGGGGAGGTQNATSLANNQAALNQVAAANNSVAASANNAANAINNTTSSTNKGTVAAKGYADSVFLAGKRYSAFVIATAVPFAGIAVIGEAVQSIIEFDQAIVKLDQVLRQPEASIKALRDEIIKLSQDTGTSLDELTKASQTLAQAGFLTKGPEDFAKFLEPLSKVPLLPSFDSIQQATEGVIVALNQFSKAGLEPIDVLDKLTRVSDKFAVSSSDLIEGLKRGGGAFAAIGGSFDEFLALLTTVKSTTQESAQTIGTSLSTLATRLAKPATTTFLEGIGVQVRDTKGELLGVIDIIKNVSQVFNAAGKEQQALIATQLGGLRNVGRIFAALNNTDLTQSVLSTSQNASGAVSESAEKGITSLKAQINLLVTEFTALAQTLAEPLFTPIITGAIELGKGLVALVDFIKPVIPLFSELITVAAGLKIFTFAASSIESLGKALSGLSLGGLSGVENFFGAARSVAGPGQSVIPVGGAGAVRAGGVSGALGAAAASQAGQLAGLLALDIAANKLAGSFSATDDSVIKLGLNTAQTAATLLGLASLITGQSVTGLFKNLSLLGGLSLGAGIIGASAISAINTQTSINIDELVKKAEVEINKLKVVTNENGTIDLTGTTQPVVDQISATFKGIAEQFNPATLKGFTSSLSEKIGQAAVLDIADAFDLEPSLRRATDTADKLIKSNFDLFSGIIKGAIAKGGPNFAVELQKLFTDLFSKSGFKNSDQLGALFAARLASTLTGNAAVEAKAALEREAANRLIVENTKKVASEIAGINIPSKLSDELNILAEAVKKTSQSIDTSVNTFNGLTSVLGKAQTPLLPETFTPEATKQALINQGAGVFGNNANLADLGQATQQFLKIQEDIKLFTETLTASADKLNTSKFKISDFLDKFTKDFVDAHPDLSPEEKKSIETLSGHIGIQLQEALSNGTIKEITPDQIKGIAKNLIGSLVNVPDQVIKEAQTFLQEQAKLQNTQLKAGNIQTEILQGGNPATILQNLIDSLNKAKTSLGQFGNNIGETIPLVDSLGNNIGISVGGSVKDASAALGDLGTDVSFARNVVGQLSDALNEQDAAYKKVNEATITGKGDLNKLTDEYITSSTKVDALKSAIFDLAKGSELATQNIKQQDNEDDDAFKLRQQQRTEEANAVKEILTTGAKLVELRAAEQQSSIFVDAQSRFSVSVDEFAKSINTVTASPIFGGNAGSGPVPGTQLLNTLPNGATNFQQNPNGTVQAAQAPLTNLGEVQAQVNDIFKKQLDANETIAETISNSFANIAQIPDLISQGFKALTGQALTTTGLPQAQFSPETIQNAIQATLSTIAEQNKTSPSALSFLGSSLQEVQSKLKLTIDPETQDKLQIKLSPEQEQLFRQNQPVNGLQQNNETTTIDDLQSSAANLNTSSETLNNIIQNLSAVIQPQTIAANNQNLTEISPQQQQQQQQAGLGDLLTEVANLFAPVIAALTTQTEAQTAVAENTSKVSIEGLSGVEDAANKNSEALASASEGVNSLTNQLASTADALNKGVGITVQAVQDINVNVQGVSDEIAGLQQKFEDLAREVAKQQISSVLDSLAANAQDTDSALAFSNAKDQLA